MDSITVRTTISHAVPKPIAVQFGHDFLEWLEGKGFRLDGEDAFASVKDLGYQELAEMYFEECS